MRHVKIITAAYWWVLVVVYFRVFMRFLVLVVIDRIPWDLKILWTKCGLNE